MLNTCFKPLSVMMVLTILSFAAQALELETGPANEVVHTGPSMLTTGDINGDALALENEFAYETALNEVTETIIEERVDRAPAGEALHQAILSHDQLRSVEIFLQSAPFTEGGVRVITAGDD